MGHAAMWVPVHSPAALLPVQVPPNGLGKAAAVGPSILEPRHPWYLDEELGAWPSTGCCGYLGSGLTDGRLALILKINNT